MMTIIFDKPSKSVQVIGYGVDSYVTKEGNTIYKVYGVINEPRTARLVDNDHKDSVKTLYLEGNEVTIYRSTDLKRAQGCKNAIDNTLARGMLVFPVEAYKQMEEQAIKEAESKVVNLKIEPKENVEHKQEPPDIHIVKNDINGGDTNAH